MLTIESLAKQLLATAGDRDPYGIEITDGVRVKYNMYGYPFWFRDNHFPDSTQAEMVKEHLHPEEQEKYWAHHRLWTGKILKRWVTQIQYVVKERAELGIFDAFDAFSACQEAALNDPYASSIAKEEGFWDYELDAFSIREHHTKEIRRFIDLFMSLPKLLLLFHKYALHQTHYSTPVDYELLYWVLNAQNKLEEDTIDLGCGDGMNFLSIESHLMGNLFAYDMQNLPVTFANWTNGDSRIHFEAIDPMQIPNPDNSIGVIILVGVVGHWEYKSLLKVLSECRRVLKTGGTIYVAPINRPARRYNPDPSLTFGGFEVVEDGFIEVWP